MEWGEIIRLIGGLGKVGAASASLFQSEPQPMGMNEAMQSLFNAQTYSNAAMNPDSPYFKNLAATEEEKMRMNLIESIREIMKQNNIATARGVAPATINPERRDEMVSRTLSRGFYEAGIRSREQARQFLMNAAAANQGQAAVYGRLSPMAYTNQLFNRANKNSGTNLLFDSLNALTKDSKKFGTDSVPNAFKPDPFYGAWF